MIGKGSKLPEAVTIASAVMTALLAAILVLAWVLRYYGNEESFRTIHDICVFAWLIAAPITVIIAAAGLTIVSDSEKPIPRRKTLKAVCFSAIVLLGMGFIAYFFLRTTVI